MSPARKTSSKPKTDKQCVEGDCRKRRVTQMPLCRVHLELVEPTLLAQLMTAYLYTGDRYELEQALKGAREGNLWS